MLPDTMKTTKTFLLLVLFILPVVCNAQLTFGTLSPDQITGAELNANDRSAVVLIHGWTGENPNNAPTNSYATGDLAVLSAALKARLIGTNTRLLWFHWEQDASTGVSIDYSAIYAFSAVGFYNASVAAANAFSDGAHLGNR